VQTIAACLAPPRAQAEDVADQVHVALETLPRRPCATNSARCTGYANIVDAIVAAGEEIAAADARTRSA
jgi:aerobic-type carbon monoxide dehydrogenase small subunit (CoxS/CutS family)